MADMLRCGAATPAYNVGSGFNQFNCILRKSFGRFRVNGPAVFKYRGVVTHGIEVCSVIVVCFGRMTVYDCYYRVFVTKVGMFIKFDGLSQAVHRQTK
jgi:hypothetical protein